MAVTKVDPRAGIGEHVTGRDIAVRKLVTKAGKRIMKENLADDMFETARHAAEVTAAMRSLDARVQSIMTTPYKGRIKVSKHNQKVAIGDRVVSRPIAPLDISRVPSLQERDSISFTPLSANEARQQEYERRTTIAQRQHDARMIKARAIGRGEISGIAMANRIAVKQADEVELRKRRDEVANRAEEDIKRRNENAENRRETKNIRSGIQSAFGGSGLKLLRAMFWTGNIARMIRHISSNAIRAAYGAQATDLTATSVGSTFGQLRTMGNVARIFGGNEGDAASLLATINSFTRGALLGGGLGNLGVAALRYGLDVTGSGPGGLATADEILDRISDLLNTYSSDREMQAQIARDIGLAPSMLEAMKDGSEIFRERLSKQNVITEKQLDEIKESAKELRQLGNSWTTFKEVLLSSATPIVKGTTGYLQSRIEDPDLISTDVLKAMMPWNPAAWNHEYERLKRFFRDKSNSDIDMDSTEWYDFGHSGANAIDRVYRTSSTLPPRYQMPSVFPSTFGGYGSPEIKFDFNFGNIELTPAQKEAGKSVVVPWLESLPQYNMIVNPLQTPN